MFFALQNEQSCPADVALSRLQELLLFLLRWTMLLQRPGGTW